MSSSRRPLFVRLLDTVKSHVEADSLYFEALRKVLNELPADLRAGLETESALAVTLRDVAFPDDPDSLSEHGTKLAAAVVRILQTIDFSEAYPSPSQTRFQQRVSSSSDAGVDPFLVWLITTADGKATGFRWITTGLTRTAASAAGDLFAQLSAATDAPAASSSASKTLALLETKQAPSAKELRLEAREAASQAAVAAALPALKAPVKEADEEVVQLILDASELALHRAARETYDVMKHVYVAVDAIRQDPEAVRRLEEAFGTDTTTDLKDEIKAADEEVIQLLLDAAELELQRENERVYEETAVMVDAWNMAIKDDTFVQLFGQVRSEALAQQTGVFAGADEKLFDLYRRHVDIGADAATLQEAFATAIKDASFVRELQANENELRRVRGISFDENQELVKRKIIDTLETALEQEEKQKFTETPAFRAQQDAVLDKIIDTVQGLSAQSQLDRISDNLGVLESRTFSSERQKLLGATRLLQPSKARLGTADRLPRSSSASRSLEPAAAAAVPFGTVTKATTREEQARRILEHAKRKYPHAQFKWRDDKMHLYVWGEKSQEIEKMLTEDISSILGPGTSYVMFFVNACAGKPPKA